MSVYITREPANLMTVQITGTLRAQEWKNCQKMIHDQLQPKDRISLLVVADQFSGFAEGDWGDLSYQSQLDEHVDKLAIVIDPQWQERAMLFAGKGFRKIELEYFPPSDIERARTWATTVRRGKS